MGQKSDKSRTKVGQKSDKSRTKVGQKSDKSRTKVRQKSDKSQKNIEKYIPQSTVYTYVYVDPQTFEKKYLAKNNQNLTKILYCQMVL
jgi:hypothetical protein